MSEPKLTPWFPAHVKPARPGVYKKDFSLITDIREFQYWTGNRWIYGADTPEDTAANLRNSRHYGAHPGPRPWRGLAEKPQ